MKKRLKNEESPLFLSRWILPSMNNDGKDNIDRFVRYYIAFNYLYERYYDEFYAIFISYVERYYCLSKYEYIDESGITSYDFPEWLRYKFFLYFLNDELSNHGFNPYTRLNENSAMVIEKVKNLGKGRYQPREIKLDEKKRIWLIYNIFDNIYAIRCNLFHGSKIQDSLRDSKLIQESSGILEDILYAFMSFQFGEDWRSKCR